MVTSLTVEVAICTRTPSAISTMMRPLSKTLVTRPTTPPPVMIESPRRMAPIISR